MDEDLVFFPDDLWLEAKSIYKYILIGYGDNSPANEYANAHFGDILLMLGETDLAETHIRIVISYDPQNPRYWYLMGKVHQARLDWDNAAKEYELAFCMEPWNRSYLLALGEATVNSGDRKTGIEYLHQVTPLYPDNSGMLTELATAYLSLGDIESARQFAERAIAIRPDDIMAWIVLKKTYISGNGLNDARMN
ncbi:MAG: tetratricopeptide repeat protein [Chloroflexi bacterium]|nr:tetratricopeptide repeat protein [Chloroflexota bacterium]